jgi:DNA-binding CsgD family transcriptional regulator
MTLAEQAAELRAQGFAGTRIAERLGISRSRAYELLSDPTGEKNRERKRRYDLVCVDCGGRVDGTTPSKMLDRAEPVCGICAPAHYAVWTCEAILCAINEWAEEHGGIPPAACEWMAPAVKRGPYPSVNHVRNRFGSWNAGIIAAGLEPHATGPVGGYTPLTPRQRNEAARRYAAGESSTSIAADLGCRPNSVIKWVRRAGVPIRVAVIRRAA